MVPKILVAFATYEGYGYCINEFIDHIKKLDYSSYDTLCIDNSKDERFAEYIQSQGIQTIHLAVDRHNTSPKDIILKSRKKIHLFFVEHKYDYLLSLDCDVMVKPDLLKKLLAHDKDIVTGLYLYNPQFEGKDAIYPLLFTFGENNRLRAVKMSQTFENQLIEIAAAGWGCVLVKRKVLEEIELRRLPTTTEDVFFYLDARAKGFKAYADTSIKCFHMIYPKGDTRNEFYRWENYMNKKKTNSESSYSFSFSVE